MKGEVYDEEVGMLDEPVVKFVVVWFRYFFDKKCIYLCFFRSL